MASHLLVLPSSRVPECAGGSPALLSGCACTAVRATQGERAPAAMPKPFTVVRNAPRPTPSTAQPHWHGFPDWHPHPHPDPQPQAAIKVRFLISAGCSVGRSCVGSGGVPGVLGESAMVPPQGWSLCPLDVRSAGRINGAQRLPSAPNRHPHARGVRPARPQRQPRTPGGIRPLPPPPPTASPAGDRPRAHPSPGTPPAWRPRPRGRRTARSSGRAG
jgi:hypothetical protein